MAWSVAVLIVVGAVGTVVVTRRVAGVVATRVLGSILFVAGIASLLTYYQTYWLDGRYLDHLHFVAPAVAIIGLAAVLFGGRRFSFGGLSLVAGLLAVGCMATASANLPEIGSYARDALTVAALASAFLAVSAGLGAISPYRRSPSRLAAAALAALGAIVTVISGIDAYPIYGEASEQTDHCRRHGRRSRRVGGPGGRACRGRIGAAPVGCARAVRRARAHWGRAVDTLAGNRAGWGTGGN